MYVAIVACELRDNNHLSLAKEILNHDSVDSSVCYIQHYTVFNENDFITEYPGYAMLNEALTATVEVEADFSVSDDSDTELSFSSDEDDIEYCSIGTQTEQPEEDAKKKEFVFDETGHCLLSDEQHREIRLKFGAKKFLEKQAQALDNEEFSHAIKPAFKQGKHIYYIIRNKK